MRAICSGRKSVVGRSRITVLPRWADACDSDLLRLDRLRTEARSGAASLLATPARLAMLVVVEASEIDLALDLYYRS